MSLFSKRLGFSKIPLQMFFLVLMVQTIGACSDSFTTPVSENEVPKLETINALGQVYYKIQNTKGIILCFHGSGGSANGWTSGENFEFLDEMNKKGYGFICPTSLNRIDRMWSADNTSSNEDAVNVDNILTHFNISTNIDIFLVGHSNGGGFTSRYAVFSSRGASIKGVQLSNASGLAQIMSNSLYTYPTLFNYAECDQVVDFNQVVSNINLLNTKTPSVLTMNNELSQIYQPPRFSTCHQFANTHTTTADFFDML